jgi:hypothetical protein
MAFDQLLGFAGFCTVYEVKVKVNVTLERATKAQKGSGGITLLFL